MSDTQHYRFQSAQAKRLAYQVNDTTVREKLLEMAEEYGRYADLIESRAAERAAEPIARWLRPAGLGTNIRAAGSFRHEDPGRKLQHGAAGRGGPRQRGYLRSGRPASAIAGRKEAVPSRRPDACPRRRRAARTQYQPARALSPPQAPVIVLSPMDKTGATVIHARTICLIPQKPFAGMAGAEVRHEVDERTRSPDRPDRGIC
jgi:hypothetical protein